MRAGRFVVVVAVAVLAGACGTEDSAESTSTLTATAVGSGEAQSAQTGMGQGVGGSMGMMERHRSPVPAEYAGMTNPVVADEESLARGAAAFTTCAVCHGDSALGDGAAAASLDPAPVNIAHTSQMMGDDYLFWRISEGGAEFGTAMPAWKDALDERTRWDLINYVQALGAGSVTSGGGMGGMGGAGSNAQAQAVQQAALLRVAVEQGVVSEGEADVFASVHPVVDARMAELRGTSSAGVDTMLTTALTELVASADLTQDQADTFLSVHDRLAAAGLLS